MTFIFHRYAVLNATKTGYVLCTDWSVPEKRRWLMDFE